MKKHGSPPRMFQRFFRWFCRPQLRDAIEGDLLELYGERVRAKGKRKADLLFVIDVMLLLRPGITRSIRRHGFHYQNSHGMVKHYWKTALRRLARDKGYSAINIAGLSIGIADSNGQILHGWRFYLTVMQSAGWWLIYGILPNMPKK